ncbi:MAG: N-acetylmuramoyl-L-alanine amidase [Bacillota bacterium]
MVTIVGDIGHGGPDPGCVVDGVREADYQLPIGLFWQEQLIQRYDVNVILTRDSDRSVDPTYTGDRRDLWRELRARCSIANRIQADLLFSKHHNASPNPTVRGGELYVYGAPDWAVATETNHKAPRSYAIAKRMAPILQAFLASWGIPFRGIRVAAFDVLEYTKGPAVLCEPFYATNPQDLTIAMKSEFQQGLVETYVQMVAVGLGLKERQPGPFSDVPADHWAAGMLASAKAIGVTAGYPDGTFGLGKPLTREEGAAMAVRSFQAAIAHICDKKGDQ